MFRKSLFFGLTLMLAAVLVYLVIQGRHRERLRQTNAQPVEVIRNSPPSLTRVIAPSDLEIVESKMELGTVASKQGQGAQPRPTASHRIVIRDDGSAAYHSFALKITYFGRSNKVLESRTVPVAEVLQPGQARSVSEVKVEDVPADTVRCEVTVAYADLEPAPDKSKPTPAETK